jgi:FlaA1/EpsC-like NDP-sugar epimerase
MVSQVRHIEINELLCHSSEVIVGRTIIVTGAGRSIGSKLCRKIAQRHPKWLVISKANEFTLHNIHREMESPNQAIAGSILGSVIDEPRVAQAINQHGTEVVFHAPAHKHVLLVKANAFKGIRTNVFDTKTVAEVAFRLGGGLRSDFN